MYLCSGQKKSPTYRSNHFRRSNFGSKQSWLFLCISRHRIIQLIVAAMAGIPVYGNLEHHMAKMNEHCNYTDDDHDMNVLLEALRASTAAYTANNPPLDVPTPEAPKLEAPKLDPVQFVRSMDNKSFKIECMEHLNKDAERSVLHLQCTDKTKILGWAPAAKKWKDVVPDNMGMFSDYLSTVLPRRKRGRE